MEDRLEERPELAARQGAIEIGDGSFGASRPHQQHAEGEAEAERGEHRRPIAPARGPGERAAFDANRRVQRIAA